MKTERQLQLLLDAHLKQRQELSRLVQAQLGPALEAQQALRESLQQALQPILATRELWAEFAGSVQIPKIDLPDLSGVAAQLTDLQRSVQQSIAPALEELRRSFVELPPRTRKALLTLGAHGWYLDLHIPLPIVWELENALADGNVAEAEQALCDYFENRLDAIEASVVARFPARAHLVKAAFAAHRSGEYALSIPVFLAQTDGICKDVTDHYLFIKQGKKQDRRPGTALYVERVTANSIRAALLSPLAETLPISQSEHERGEGFDLLNRHMVLHGESLNYDTKTNSLKAVSLINYVAQVLRDKATEKP